MKHPVDVHVGKRIRHRRWLVGVTQQQLADKVGIKFQQIQKYENGTNRIGAGRLEEIAKILGVPIASFFSPQSSEENQSAAAASMTNALQSTQLVRSFVRIKDEGVREAIVELLDRLGPARGA